MEIEESLFVELNRMERKRGEIELRDEIGSKSENSKIKPGYIRMKKNKKKKKNPNRDQDNGSRMDCFS